VTRDGWISAVARYSERLHVRAGTSHHVASGLGAWVLVALCAPLVDAAARSELAEALGADPMDAAKFAAALLSQPHPLVAAGAGVWIAPAVNSTVMERWQAELPAVVTTGDVPTQTALDAWATERTLGLIERFPVTVTPKLVCLLATALATKVSWEVPFEVVEAAELAPSPWATELRRVLRSPLRDPRHRQYITHTERAGRVAVHLTGARGGLLVGSVIAIDETVPVADVLAAAEDIVTSEATEPLSVGATSLFDLPLGEASIWTISEEPVETESPDGREEVAVAVLPAWAADTTVSLDDARLGIPTVAEAIKNALGLPDLDYDASQVAMARYSAIGFEAAAVTRLAFRSSRPQMRPGHRRTAMLRFGHPYAVVAATSADQRVRPNAQVAVDWHGLPVFSAWVAEPTEAS
jgi:hypothetical protein